MDRPFIHTSNLCRFYTRGTNKVRAVDSISLEVIKEELVAVVGTSGSGKTTLLNLLAGLDSPTSGTIEVAGRNLGNLSHRQLSQYRAKYVGMVFQSFNLIPNQTALKNVEMALYFNNTSKRDREEQAVKTLTLLGLEDRMEHKPSDLSGGEQQRVAIARALVKKPEILFADEPTGNLDQQNAKAVADILVDLKKKGLTVIIVTHNLEVAERVAERVVKMHYGKIVEDTI
ncbi:MAG: ATP-binding cassette domain-containing protein [candidate division Zixibacteria bacterium]|nr:ATP-binding cassette domain-containing protein [candidate division Zixibacteria bacterium]